MLPDGYLLFSEVAPLVVTHVALGPETFAATLWAGEWSLIPMDSHMDLQILLLTECLRARGERTLVGLSPVVQVHVRTQSYPPRKHFLARSDWTDKLSLPSTALVVLDRLLILRVAAAA